MSQWLAHVTVATVIENNGKFLIVEEYNSRGKAVFNQPAGHLEANESLIDAARRECLEETGWDVNIEGFIGIALYTAPSNGITYQRNTFTGSAIKHHSQTPLDDGIIGAHWLSLEDIKDLHQQGRLRSHLVLTTIEQYLQQPSYPLSLVYS